MYNLNTLLIGCEKYGEELTQEIMNWYFQTLKKYAVFSGRAGRAEYWYFVLFSTIIGLVLLAISGRGAGTSFNVLSFLSALAILIPSLAVSVRRLHDTGRSGLWLFISIVPFIGLVILLIFMRLLDSRYKGRKKPWKDAWLSLLVVNLGMQSLKDSISYQHYSVRQTTLWLMRRKWLPENVENSLMKWSFRSETISSDNVMHIFPRLRRYVMFGKG